MITATNLVEYEKCYPKRLKRIFRQGVQYNTYNDFVPKTENSRVGNFPSEIVNLFKPEEREVKLKAFQKAFSDAANYIRSNHEEDIIDFRQGDKFCIDSMLGCAVGYARKLLNSGLREVLPSGYKADFEYVDYGGFKNVYKFNIKDVDGKKIMHDKAIHVYRKLSEGKKHDYQHGNFAEPNFWMYLSYRAGHPLNKTQFTKHYISDLGSGYSMTEFADESIQKTTNPFRTKGRLFMRYDDIEHNPLLFGKMYDVGGFRKLNNFTDDKMVMRYYKQIVNRNTDKEKEQVISNLQEKIKNPKTPHRDKMQKGIELYNQIIEQERKRQAALDELLSLL